MLSRDYNYRIHHKNRVVKKKILATPFRYAYYEKTHRSNWRNRYSDLIIFVDPEDKWFNYLGQYSNLYKKSSNKYGNNHYNKNSADCWKAKYGYNRMSNNRKIRKDINDEIGKKYYYCY